MHPYIKLLNLKKHVEGGYFSEFFKSDIEVISVNEEQRKSQSPCRVGKAQACPPELDEEQRKSQSPCRVGKAQACPPELDEEQRKSQSTCRVGKAQACPPELNVELQKTESLKRSASTSIYFLLDKNDFSTWHRLKSDELWHYYDGGSPVEIYVIDAGELSIYVLGNPRFTKNASFQVAIKAGCWFAATLRDKSSFALMGCTVAPGFEYEDFEIADKEMLIKQYPTLSTVIKQF